MDRIRQIAENEIRFREINERLAADVRAVANDDEPLDFVCECGLLDCTGAVSLTLAQYDAVRADGAQFAVLPGHQMEDVEDAVDGEDGFVVVRKHESSAPLARRTDPRSPG